MNNRPEKKYLFGVFAAAWPATIGRIQIKNKCFSYFWNIVPVRLDFDAIFTLANEL